MMIKRSLINFRKINLKRFYSNKNDDYIFNRNTYKYELNLNSSFNRLSSFESFILYPINFTKTFLSTLFN
jgi:hypothetical protein